MDAERELLEETARNEKARLNGSGNKELLFFQEVLYSGLAAYSTGDVPALQDAFTLSDENIDLWHLAVAELNPSRYVVQAYEQEALEIGERRITVLSLRPSVLMRRAHLEQESEQQQPLQNQRSEVFRVVYYPRLAGCSIGDVPSEIEARQELSVDELEAWYDVAKRMIPPWFLPVEEIAQKNELESKQDQRKKKKRQERF